jgi:NADPH:quinone reductase-like Zn-dependent oxidoreductase
MRGFVLSSVGSVPTLVDTPEPNAPEGFAAVPVRAAGLNPVDLKMAGDSKRPTPRVVGNEAVVEMGGRRCYAERTVIPHGSMAEWAVVDPGTLIDLPDGIDDASALAVGIAGLAAWIPLADIARVQHGETVAVLGATGAVGRNAVQVARLLGAGRVVAIGRDQQRLDEVRALGADATVALGSEDDAAVLREASGDGIDVVLDLVYGAPLVAVLQATRHGARVVSTGSSGATEIRLPFATIRGRTLLTHSNQLTPAEPKRAAYLKLLDHLRAGDIQVAVREFPFDDIPELWRLQGSSPGYKVVVRM